MLRALAVVAMIALTAPTLALGQEHHDQHGGKPPPGRPPGGPGPKPFVQPHGPRPHGPPPGATVRPGPVPRPGPGIGPGPGHPQFTYRGRTFDPVHAAPFVYPHGWAYRRWGIGMALPPIFLAQTYWYADWAALGLPPPQAGFQWVRYGPDLLLVDLNTGQVVDVVYGVFY